MNHVTQINKNLFWVYSSMAEYQYLVDIENEKDIEQAMKIAEREATKWGNVSELEGTEEYDYYYNAGYVQVVKEALEKAGIEAKYYTEMEG